MTLSREELEALRALALKATPSMMTSFDLGEHEGADIPTMEVSARSILALIARAEQYDAQAAETIRAEEREACDKRWREQAYKLVEACGDESLSVGGFALALATRMEAMREAPHLIRAALAEEGA